MTAPQKKARRRAGKRQATGQKKHTMTASIRQPTNNCDISAAFGGDATDTTAEWPGQPNPPGLTDPEPLPVDELPPALRRHCQSVAAAMQVPSDLPTLLALGCVSAALAGRVEVQVRAGWREPVGLYVACLLPPASRKSPCYSAMTMPVRDWETEQILKVAPTLARTRDLVAVRERALESAIRAAATHKGSEQEVAEARRLLTEHESAVPHDGRLLAGDITPEEVVRRMAAQDGRLAILEPEPGPLQLLAGRYSDCARLDELKKAWSGEPILVDRVNRSPLRVERPALTLALMLQPGVISNLPHGDAFRYEGALARFLWCAPPHGLGCRLTGADVPALDETAASEYARVLRVLLDSDAGASQPHLLTLAPEAIKHLHAFEAEVEEELMDGGRYEAVRDWAGKMVGQAVRVAALIELANRASAGTSLLDPIGATGLGGAIALLRSLATHAVYVLTGVSDDRRTADLTYLLRRLSELPEGTTETELRAATRGRATLAADAELVAGFLDELEDRGCVRRRHRPSEGRGRPPSPIVELHPDLRPWEVVNL